MLGVDTERAKELIERLAVPELKAEIVRPGSDAPGDVECDRVLLFADADDLVVKVVLG